ncbi:phage major capsid protein [Elusimicrobium posterum]|uniref:phage major capsid protein n=1 Tax=Elusimicrobium posterum TaxID=3116653 RepID=UPI003C727D60
MKVLEVMVVLTNQLMTDAGINLASFLPEWARRAIMNTWLKAMFLGDTTSATNPVIGINTASGVLTPTVADVSGLFALKTAVPVQIRATGKFYMDRAVYDKILALLITTKPTGYFYNTETGKLTIDGSEVVPLDASIIGAGNVFFGDLATIIFSPKTELWVRWSDQATVTDTDGTTQLNLFELNMQAFLFESRADLTVVGSVWAKANIA